MGRYSDILRIWAYGGPVQVGFRSGRLTSSNEGTWVHDSSAASQTVPRYPYAVPRTLFQCVCTRRRNCGHSRNMPLGHAGSTPEPPCLNQTDPPPSLLVGSFIIQAHQAPRRCARRTKAAREGLGIIRRPPAA
jgi:hypothetical protein